MTTNIGSAAEWTAPSLRPTAHWVLIAQENGTVRPEMVWGVPAVTVSDVTGSATGANAVA
jgi:hypothetical protein